MSDSLLQLVAKSDVGRVRRRNEDAVAVDEARGIAVLADGMGGLADGHLASREAVDVVFAALRDERRPSGGDALTEALEEANRRVLALAQRRGSGPMGTTLVVLRVAADGSAALAHVGDSRAYLWRRGTLSPLTRDHSLVQEMCDQGLMSAEAARHAPERNVLTQALGIEAPLEFAVTALRAEPGDLVLLCSDGLWDMLDDARIAALLAACGPGRRGLTDAADALIAAANAAGGHDNVSVVLARRPAAADPVATGVPDTDA